MKKEQGTAKVEERAETSRLLAVLASTDGDIIELADKYRVGRSHAGKMTALQFSISFSLKSKRGKMQESQKSQLSPSLALSLLKSGGRKQTNFQIGRMVESPKRNRVGLNFSCLIRKIEYLVFILTLI